MSRRLDRRGRRPGPAALRRGWLVLAGLAACVHAAPRPSASIAAPAAPSATPEQAAADRAYAEALADLAAARPQSAGEKFRQFAERFPQDRRVGTARLQQAFAALTEPDQVRGLDQAQTLLAQLPAGSGDAEAEALRELQAVILARAQVLQAQAAAAQQSGHCEEQPDAQADRERAQLRAQVAHLQQELQRRERTLEQVKVRLLEIQQETAQMLGAPLSPPAPEPAAKP